MDRTAMAKEYIGIIGSRIIDGIEEVLDDIETVIRTVKIEGKGIILSAASGIDARTLAILLQNHADDVDFQVYMEQNSVDDFAAHIEEMVDQDLIDRQEADYTMQQIHRLERQRPEALIPNKTNPKAKECGRYSQVVIDCDQVFAFYANENNSPTVDTVVEYVNDHSGKCVIVKKLTRAAA